MKYAQIAKAFPALNELKKLKLPYSVAKRLYELHKKVENEFRFLIEEERKLIDLYAAKLPDGTPNIGETGLIHFDDPTAAAEYSATVTALNDTECDLKVAPITLSEDFMSNMIISPEMIENLSEFVIFD